VQHASTRHTAYFDNPRELRRFLELHLTVMPAPIDSDGAGCAARCAVVGRTSSTGAAPDVDLKGTESWMTAEASRAGDASRWRVVAARRAECDQHTRVGGTTLQP
jgi:hypothetical protein